ncbi:hypothetical protein [Streptomonospora alba]|uniref:hypothetical protein n=1 Tax=Streptomonospora alba TaxID=183763 RepID=UPI0012EDEA85|nr:hypothetical protein [Streptomonospora alba]
MIDTLRLAKRTGATVRSLTALVDRYALRGRLGELVPDGRPHRALWDTVAAALLLHEIVAEQWTSAPGIDALVASAGERFGHRNGPEQQTLL